VPGSFATHALRAQAIAARSYALYAVQARGQHWGYRRWDGCNCALYGTVHDQHFAGFAKEQGYYGARWVAAGIGTSPGSARPTCRPGAVASPASSSRASRPAGASA